MVTGLMGITPIPPHVFTLTSEQCMMTAAPLTLSRLTQALQNTDARKSAAIRFTAILQPAGGVGDKIFPPTYKDGKNAVERRRVGELELETVLLDSVASQANRMESALREAWEEGRLELPNITVDFTTGNPQFPHIGQLTALDVPHRIADAILRDSLLEGVPFRQSKPGQSFTMARTNNATALFELCPTALLFGVWDSAGPAGGLGAKFARTLVSEIVGLDAVPGKRVASRIDPLQIALAAGPVYEHPSDGWTLDEKEATRDDKKKGEPKKKGDGKPSEINHGNVTPSIGDGGYTVREARQISVLSLTGLRRLRFPSPGQGLTPEGQRDRDNAARLVLTTLGLCALRLALEQGTDLRSRCQLVPATPPTFELVSSSGEAPEAFSLSVDQALELYAQAVAQARALGFHYPKTPVQLTPTPKLVQLLEKSVALLMKSKEA